MRKPPTIHDVANALGMHKSTVSLALSGKGTIAPATRQRVQAAAREMGYEPNMMAQRLARGHGNNAVVCLFSGVLDVGLATEKLLKIQKGLNARGLEVPIYACGEAPGTEAVAQIKHICRQRPRAIVCAAWMLKAMVLRELECYQCGGGIVVTYDISLPLDCDQVLFDREDNAYQGARYLIERGHRRIGVGMSLANQDRDDRWDTPQAWRIRGFRRAFEEARISLRPEWIFQNPTYEKGGAVMARRFLEMSDRPTALCIVNDYVALAFMVEVMGAGVRVPQDVSIISHDDQPIASYCPVPMTTITQPTDAIADAVVEIMTARLDGDTSPPRTVLLRGKCVERDSVDAPSS